MKIEFKQDDSLPYSFAVRMKDDGIEVLYAGSPVALKAVEKMRGAMSSPLFMALVKSQFGKEIGGIN